MKSISTFLFASFLFISCAPQSHTKETLKTALIQEFLNHPALQYAKNKEGKLIIQLSTPYCETNDCTAYFQEYDHAILFYKKSDIFMRNLQKYVEIVEIDKQKHHIQVQKINGWRNVSETINIQL